MWHVVLKNIKIYLRGQAWLFCALQSWRGPLAPKVWATWWWLHAWAIHPKLGPILLCLSFEHYIVCRLAQAPKTNLELNWISVPFQILTWQDTLDYLERCKWVDLQFRVRWPILQSNRLWMPRRDVKSNSTFWLVHIFTSTNLQGARIC